MKTKLLITGGAGFIGSNLASFFSNKGYSVTILDNFERKGSVKNVKWLKENYPHIEVVKEDIKNSKALEKEIKGKDIIFHLAGQVAVTTSVENPRQDFESNALGTFNVLEAARKSGHKPLIVYASTNKVYGGMENIRIIENKNRYEYKDFPYGISEKTNLDFHSPYGCSKGAGDQYIRDYERIYDIPTVVFRQSCIYGPRQFGIEDQGWLAWLIIAITYGRPFQIYGNGKQVRDILYIDDLVKAYEKAVEKIEITRGKIYNIGGGPNNSISVWKEFQPILEKLFQKPIKASFANWRPGDQKVYISDIRLIHKDLGWKPQINVEEGIVRLFKWVQENKKLFQEFL